jgi:hypothetical protein
LGIGYALGSGGGVVEVAEPLLGYEFLQVSRVSYNIGFPQRALVPGFAVSLIGLPGCVCDENGRSLNLNAANILGIKAGYDPYHAETSKLHGDTLHVFLDLSGLPPDTTELEGYSIDTIIRATVECVLVTAYDSRTAIADADTFALVEAKHVWLEVRGSDRYAALGGVFSFADLGQLPRERLFR